MDNPCLIQFTCEPVVGEEKRVPVPTADLEMDRIIRTRPSGDGRFRLDP